MLEEYLTEFGYNEKQTNKILKIFPANKYSQSTLLYHLKNYHQYFEKNNMKKEEIIDVIMTIPNIMTESVENIKVQVQELTSLGFHKIDIFKMIKKYPYILELSIPKIKNKIEQLQSFSFSKKQALIIFSEYPSLLKVESSFEKKIKYFRDFGYSKEETTHILTLNPELMMKNISDLDKKMKELHTLGFHSIDIIKTTTIVPEILTSPIDLIKEKFRQLLEFGYTEIDIIEIIKKVPFLLKENYLEEMPNHLDFLLSCGFSKEKVIFMTCNNPYIFCYSTESILNKMENIGNLGYRLEDVLKMLEYFPLLFGYRIETTQEKLEYYREIGLESIVLENSTILRFPLPLIKERKAFFEKREEKEEKDLFIEDTKFYQKYKITRESLLKGEY